MDRLGQTTLARRNTLRGALNLVTLAAALLSLALPATANAITPQVSNTVAKDRGFTITPPYPRGKSYTMGNGYGSGKHDNVGTQDYFSLDFTLVENDPVHPVAPGKVKIAKNNTTETNGFEPYGKLVLIEHSNGYFSLYAHLNDVSVNVGQWVDVDSPIGKAGATGSGSGGQVHLHFTLYKGTTSISASPASWSSGTAVVPEPFSGCTKSAGGDCEDIVAGNVLRRDDFAPAVAGGVTTDLDLVACNRSAANLMYNRRDTSANWMGWENLGGTCGSSPAVVRDALGNLFVFVRGIDAGLYVKKKLSNAPWSNSWEKIADSVVGRPSAAFDAASKVVRVFVKRAPNQSVYVQSQVGQGSASFTTPPANLGGTLTNSPVAAARSDGHLDVYGAASDSTFWKIPSNSDGSFTPEWWHPLYVSLEGEPSFVAQGATSFAARTTGDKLYLQGGSTQGAATHRPAIARNLDGTLILFERNRYSSAFDYYFQTSAKWVPGAWVGLVTSELAALRSKSNRVMVFAWQTGGLWYREQAAYNANSWNAWVDLQIPY
jgi:hypothetical protein